MEDAMNPKTCSLGQTTCQHYVFLQLIFVEIQGMEHSYHPFPPHMISASSKNFCMFNAKINQWGE